MTDEQKIQLWIDLTKFLKERRVRMLAGTGEFEDIAPVKPIWLN